MSETVWCVFALAIGFGFVALTISSAAEQLQIRLEQANRELCDMRGDLQRIATSLGIIAGVLGRVEVVGTASGPTKVDTRMTMVTSAYVHPFAATMLSAIRVAAASPEKPGFTVTQPPSRSRRR